MATIQRPIKTYGTRTYVAEVAAAPSNQDPILANEVDGDIDTIYSAWNGGADTVNIKDGAISRAKLSTTDVTPSLPPIPIATDANKTVVVNAAGNGLILGTGGTFAGATPPATPQVGQLWWRSDPDGNLFIYYDDGNSKQFVPAVPSSVGPWSVSGSTITPTDATKSVTVPATAGAAALTYGTRTIKGRVQAQPTGDSLYWTSNALLNAGATAWAQDDVSKASWIATLSPAADQYWIGRVAPGGTITTALLTLDNTGALTIQATDGNSGNVYSRAGGTSGGTGGTGSFKGFGSRGTGAAPTAIVSGDLIAQLTAVGCYAAGVFSEQALLRFNAAESWSGTARGVDCTIYVTPAGTTNPTGNYCQINNSGSLYISGPTGQKSTGTTWANPSDIRLKKNVAKYARGLSDILQLEPISYTLKRDDIDTCGFDAEAVRAVFPECVGSTKMKVEPDDEEETEVLTLDIHPILIALVHAVQQLAEKIGQ